jgi:hypothetical protein
VGSRAPGRWRGARPLGAVGRADRGSTAAVVVIFFFINIIVAVARTTPSAPTAAAIAAVIGTNHACRGDGPPPPPQLPGHIFAGDGGDAQDPPEPFDAAPILLLRFLFLDAQRVHTQFNFIFILIIIIIIDTIIVDIIFDIFDRTAVFVHSALPSLTLLPPMGCFFQFIRATRRFSFRGANGRPLLGN